MFSSPTDTNPVKVKDMYTCIMKESFPDKNNIIPKIKLDKRSIKGVNM